MTATCDAVGLSPEETERQLAKWERGRWRLAQKWHRMYPTIAMDDLYSAATVGFLEAAKRYRPDRGAAFSTYAHAWAFKELMDLCRSELGHGISYPHARKLAEGRALVASLDALATSFNFDLPSRHEPEPLRDSEAKVRFWRTVSLCLPKRDYQILRQVYCEGRTAREIAHDLGLVPQRVQQIVQQSIRRLRTIDRCHLSRFVGAV